MPQLVHLCRYRIRGRGDSHRAAVMYAWRPASDLDFSISRTNKPTNTTERTQTEITLTQCVSLSLPLSVSGEGFS